MQTDLESHFSWNVSRPFSDYLRRWICEIKKNSSFRSLVRYNHSIPYPILLRVNFLQHRIASKKGKYTDTQFNSLWRGVYFRHCERRRGCGYTIDVYIRNYCIYIWATYIQATVYITLHCIFSGDFIGSICISFYRSLGVFCYFTVPAFYGFQRRTKCCMCVNSSQVVYNNVQGDAILRKLLCGFDDNGLRSLVKIVFGVECFWMLSVCLNI